jgi:hypothetical protein
VCERKSRKQISKIKLCEVHTCIRYCIGNLLTANYAATHLASAAVAHLSAAMSVIPLCALTTRTVLAKRPYAGCVVNKYMYRHSLKYFQVWTPVVLFTHQKKILWLRWKFQNTNTYIILFLCIPEWATHYIHRWSNSFWPYLSIMQTQLLIFVVRFFRKKGQISFPLYMYITFWVNLYHSNSSVHLISFEHWYRFVDDIRRLSTDTDL